MRPGLRLTPAPGIASGMANPPPIFDRKLLAHRRTRVAATIEAHDFLLARAAADIVERLSIVTRTFPRVLVVGAHHGTLSCALQALPGVAEVVSLDPAAGMLARCPAPTIDADEEHLPFEPETFDLAVTAHALHTVNDLPGALIQIRRTLKPDGLLLATFPGGETLKELRAAWLEAETDLLSGASPRVSPFAEVRDCGSLLQRAGFALPVSDSETVTVTYANPLALMAELKAMGQSNMLIDRSRRPVTRRLLMRAAEIYTQRFGLPNGRVPATFEMISLTGWVPHESQPKPLRPGSAAVRLADALGVKEQKA